MSGLTDWYANQVLQEIANGAWISLHYDSPELDGLGGSEIAGAGYVRPLVGFTQPANRIIWSVEDAVFVGLNATRATHFGVWNAATSGNMYAFGKLPGNGVTILQGQGWVLKEGTIAISVA